MEIGQNSSNLISGQLQRGDAIVRKVQPTPYEQERLRREQQDQRLGRDTEERAEEGSAQGSALQVTTDDDRGRDLGFISASAISAPNTNRFNSNGYSSDSVSRNSSFTAAPPPQRLIQMALQAYNSQTASPIIIGGGELMPRFDAMA
ncbi:MAG: hypothetical protein HQL48_00490 [Gammaproteobacteria bacterium]|nr:hypothetical protein [Gammaproteobacteria bacterium]